MRPLRIYTDTSVIGGCLDPEFREASTKLFEAFRAGDAILVLSDLTILELELAPEAVRDVLSQVPPTFTEMVEYDQAAADLADRYVAEKVISARMRFDAQHIATATIQRVDVLVSWNFRHIVNLGRIHGYNSVNMRHGYATLEIRSPQEVLSYGED